MTIIGRCLKLGSDFNEQTCFYLSTISRLKSSVLVHTVPLKLVLNGGYIAMICQVKHVQIHKLPTTFD